jgi:hypothetical protein
MARRSGEGNPLSAFIAGQRWKSNWQFQIKHPSVFA